MNGKFFGSNNIPQILWLWIGRMSEILPETNYPELLIGWNIGYRIGSNLDIYSLKEEDKPRLISSIKYSEIVGIEDRRGINNEIKPVLIDVSV